MAKTFEENYADVTSLDIIEKAVFSDGYDPEERIAELEATIDVLTIENNFLRNWIMMETGADEQHVNDVLSDEASLSDEVKKRYG